MRPKRLPCKARSSASKPLPDRNTVTNRQFQVFVTAGGYDQMAIWDPAIWPAVLDFVDATGHPGPRYWQHGRFPPGKADHPVGASVGTKRRRMLVGSASGCRPMRNG